MTTPTVGLVMPTSFDPASVVAGGERYAYELARALSRLTPTTLFTFSRTPTRVTVGDLTIRYCRSLMDAGGGINPLSVAHLGALRTCDVIHTLQPHTIVTDLALIWGRLWRRRTFLTDLAGGAPIRPSRLLPMRNLMTGFLPISEYNRRLNPQITRPTTVIGSGVDTDSFAPDPAATRHQRRVLYLGRLFPGKGLHVLLEALPDDVTLDVVGSGEGDYRARVDAMAAGKSVVFHGGLPDADVVRLYQTTALVVLPSLVDSGVTSSLEAMACGTPVVGSRLGTVAEIVTPETGWLVPPDDAGALRAALIEALSDQARLRVMGAAARADVLARFTWRAVAERCLEAYRG
jgi:glycosyltransferase involved in cell wall biosynthesis